MIICVNFIARVTAIVRNPTVLLLSTLKYEPGVNTVFRSIWIASTGSHLLEIILLNSNSLTPDLMDN